MSSKIITAVIVLGVLVLIAMWWIAAQPAPNNPGVSVQGTGENNQNMQSVSPSPSIDVSDAALDKDLVNLDSQITDLNTDAADADRGIGDQPIPQAE